MTSVDWLEVRLVGPQESSCAAEVLLQEHAFPGWVDESDDQEFRYLLYLPQEGGWQDRLQSLRQAGESRGLEVTTHGQVRDEDWAENWKRFYHPLEVGRRLVVCPSWEAFEPRPDQLVITLDPGSAFGTGYHWTTRLCLEFLEEESLRGGPMLDLGTGSGILAIAAARLGVAPLVAIDNDPVAVKVAQENAAINGLDFPVQLGESPAGGPFRLVTANLIARVLVELASALGECLAPGGRLICGGIIQERRDEVVEALEGVGLKLVSEKAQEDWVSLLLERP